MRVSTLLLCIAALALCLCMVTATSSSSAEAAERIRLHSGYSVLRVDQSNLSKSQKHALKHITDNKTFKLDRWASNDFMVPPSTLAAVSSYLNRHGLSFTTMIDDVGAQIAREDSQREAHRVRMGTKDVTAYPNGATDFFADYHSLDDIHSYLQNLESQYPSLVSSKQIGTSYGGLPIFVYRVTSPSTGSSVVKPAIYLEGGIHAREWIAHATVTYMLSSLITGYANNDTQIVNLLNKIEYHIVPVLNVDGYIYTWTTNRMWRKTTKPNPRSNCIGTDPNRNWGNHWCLVGGSMDPCDDSFCGSAAFSESCVKAAADYALANDNIVAFVDFHSYSQLWMTPYGYTSDLPTNNDAQTAMSKSAVAALESVNGIQYVEGPIYSTVYPAAGSSADWAYQNTTHVQFSFGVELRDTGNEGFLLDSSQILPSGNETLAAVIAMGEYLIANPQTYKLSNKKQIGPLKHFGNMKQYTPRSMKENRKAAKKIDTATTTVRSTIITSERLQQAKRNLKPVASSIHAAKKASRHMKRQQQRPLRN